MKMFSFSQPFYKKILKKFAAFTQSESSIIVLVLCIFGMIVIPPLVKQQIIAANRTKIKKISLMYENFIQGISLEHGIKSEMGLDTFSKTNFLNNCINMSEYFQIKINEGCTFRTVDGIWWQLYDIKNPIVAFNKKNLNRLDAESDSRNAFYLVVTYDSHSDSFRVNDKSYELNKGDETKIKRVTKIYNFIYNIK